ncbi:MAG: CDP-alcohol phosphatidyltransferase family protein [Candidatus Binatia bacterium]
MSGPRDAFSPGRRAAAWGVHLLTASSAPAGLLAIFATIRGEVGAAFLWMAYTLAVDAIDGTLARAVRVKEVLPFVDGSRLDDIVDYFTYVVVPAFFVVHTGLVPAAAAVPVVSLVLVASGYGFSQTTAKTADHFFTGFPSYWNVVAFYLYVLGWPPALNAAVLVVFAVLVFVPLRYVYPSRMTELRVPTVVLGIAWGAALLWALARFDTAPRTVLTWSLLYPAYYVGLSLYLHFRRVTE